MPNLTVSPCFDFKALIKLYVYVLEFCKGVSKNKPLAIIDMLYIILLSSSASFKVEFEIGIYMKLKLPSLTFTVVM